MRWRVELIWVLVRVLLGLVAQARVGARRGGIGARRKLRRRRAEGRLRRHRISHGGEIGGTHQSLLRTLPQQPASAFAHAGTFNCIVPRVLIVLKFGK